MKGEHPSPDVNVDETLEGEDNSYEGTGIEEVIDDYEVSTARETDDQPRFDENVGKKGNLENEVEAIPEDPDEICEDEIKNNDGYQSQEPEVIKLLFKGSFLKNSREIVELQLRLSLPVHYSREACY